MHAFAILREPIDPPVARLRALLEEPGGRRRLLEAVEDRLGPALRLDDQQLLLRAGVLFEAQRLGDLGGEWHEATSAPKRYAARR